MPPIHAPSRRGAREDRKRFTLRRDNGWPAKGLGKHEAKTRAALPSRPVTFVTPRRTAAAHHRADFRREDAMIRGRERVSIATASLRVAASLVFAGLVVTASRAAVPPHAARTPEPSLAIDSSSTAAPMLQSVV